VTSKCRRQEHNIFRIYLLDQPNGARGPALRFYGKKIKIGEVETGYFGLGGALCDMMYQLLKREEKQ
jgi:hypothetical protein